MLEKAKVTSTYDNNMARIMVMRNEMCGSCSECPVSKGEEFYMDVYNEANAKLGDDVEVEMDNNDFLGASLIMYGLPLVSFILGVIIGYFIYPIFGLSKPNEILAMLLGFICTAITYMMIRHFEPRLRKGNRYKPVIKNII
jgi:sigma-E factor negative regulatory protein RseC